MSSQIFITEAQAQAILNAILTAQKGQIGGLVSIESNGKISISLIPEDVLVGDGSITNIKLANMVAGTLKGKITIDGVPQDLTASQVRTLLNVEDGAEANDTGAEISAKLKSLTTPEKLTVNDIDGSEREVNGEQIDVTGPFTIRTDIIPTASSPRFLTSGSLFSFLSNFSREVGESPNFIEIPSLAAVSYREIILTRRGVFVMVSSSGSRITRSENGYIFYNPTSPAITTWGIVELNDVLIASAETGTGSNCMRSTNDGVTWTQINTTVDAGFRSIGKDRGVLVMAANSGVAGRVVYSNDVGLTWVASTVATELAFQGVVGGGGVFLLLGTGTVIQRSTDGGINFSNVTVSNRSWSKGIFFKGRFIIFVGGGSASKIAYSDDLGLTWTDVNSPDDTVTYTRPAIIGKWVYCGGSGGMLIRSKDGIVWETVTSGTTNTIQSLAGGRVNGEDIIIMICDGGTNRFIRSLT